MKSHLTDIHSIYQIDSFQFIFLSQDDLLYHFYWNNVLVVITVTHFGI